MRGIPAGVKIKFIDGSLAYIPATADGIPLFVGYATGTAKAKEPLAITKETDIVKLFGESRLTNYIYDFFSMGGSIAYVIKAEQPTAEGLLDALHTGIDKLLVDGLAPFEYMVVSTPVDKGIAASISSFLNSLEEQDVFTFAVARVRDKKDTETVDDFITNLIKEWEGFTSKRVAVVAGFANISNLTGKERTDNIIGLVAGLIAKAKVNQHIGEVRSFPISPITGLQPEGINQSHLIRLDGAGFIVAKSYIGKKGYFIENDNIFTDATSDYNNIRNRRVSDKAGRILRLMLLEYTNMIVEPPKDADPQNPPPPEKSPTIKDLEIKLKVGLDSMFKDGEIYGYQVEIPSNQNIWSTEKLKVKWRVAPTPVIRYIEAEHSFYNPMATRG